MSISSHGCQARGRHLGRGGFTLVELLIGIGLAAFLALALAPLWSSVERAGASGADRTVALVQVRVAAARFERDLRLAGAAGCQFGVTGSVLQASRSQVVFLQTGPDGSAPSLVEWEIAKGSLMRRVGRSPTSRPSSFAHSLYADNKTMLEKLGTTCRLDYVVDGALVPGPLPAADLSRVGSVVLTVAVDGPGTGASSATTITARVGR